MPKSEPLPHRSIVSAKPNEDMVVEHIVNGPLLHREDPTTRNGEDTKKRCEQTEDHLKGSGSEPIDAWTTPSDDDMDDQACHSHFPTRNENDECDTPDRWSEWSQTSPRDSENAESAAHSSRRKSEHLPHRSSGLAMPAILQWRYVSQSLEDYILPTAMKIEEVVASEIDPKPSDDGLDKWKENPRGRKTRAKRAKVRMLLNKIAAGNVEKIARQLLAMASRSKKDCQKTAEWIVDKALCDPFYSHTYASCVSMMSDQHVNMLAAIGGYLADRSVSVEERSSESSEIGRAHV